MERAVGGARCGWRVLWMAHAGGAWRQRRRGEQGIKALLGVLGEGEVVEGAGDLHRQTWCLAGRRIPTFSHEIAQVVYVRFLCMFSFLA